MHINSYWPNEESWRRYWPRGIVSLVAIVQLLISFAIIALHVAIVVFGLISLCYVPLAWYVIGFVAWAIFLACWISVFCVTCCNQGSVGCATYVMIKNIIGFIFAAVLLDFDNKTVSGTLITGATYLSDCNYSSNMGTLRTDSWNIFISLTKGQLAGSVIMLVSCLLFVAIYIYVYIRAVLDNENRSDPRYSSRIQYPVPMQQQEHVDVTIIKNRPEERAMPIICHRCGATVQINEQF